MVRVVWQPTCGGRSEGLDGLHEGDGDVAQADVAQHDVDAEDAGHGEDPPPPVMAVHFDEGLHLEHLDGDVGTHRGDDEVHRGHRQRKLEVQLLHQVSTIIHQSSAPDQLHCYSNMRSGWLIMVKKKCKSATDLSCKKKIPENYQIGFFAHEPGRSTCW
jgi:hypothetical protein